MKTAHLIKVIQFLCVLISFGIEACGKNMLQSHFYQPVLEWNFSNSPDDKDLNVQQNGNDEFEIRPNWKNLQKGFCLSYGIEEAKKRKDLKSIRVEMRSTGQTQIEVYAGISSLGEGFCAQDKKIAKSISDKWHVFDFPVIEMAMSFDDYLEPMHRLNNGEYCQKLNLFFNCNGTNESISDKIVVRRPSIIFHRDEIYERFYSQN